MKIHLIWVIVIAIAAYAWGAIFEHYRMKNKR